MILCCYSSITLSVTYTPLMTDDIDDVGHHYDDDDFFYRIKLR